MTTMGPHDLTLALASAVRALRDAVRLDWSVPAAGLEWSCHDTAVHVADDLTGFAAQLAGRVAGSWLPMEVVAAPGTPPTALVGLVEASGRLLSAAVYAARQDDRAWHPAGVAGADGFAAMGAAEILLHTHDILGGLGITHWRPSGRTTVQVLDRLFPHVPRPAAGDPWDALLAATGRADLPGLPRQRTWRWYNDPIRGAGVVLCEISPSLAEDLRDGGTGGFTWTEDGPVEGTRVAAALVLRARDEGTYRPGWGPYAIIRAGDRRAIGEIGFHAAPAADGHADIGYDLVPSARGHGYATRAVRALARWGFEQPGLTQLRATVDDGNPASHAVLRRAGFQKDGSVPGGVRYLLRPGG
ncbi:GNAT family N-acetyltransferase [Streptomyces sp. NPDC003042]